MATATATDPVIELHRWYPVAVVARLLCVTSECVRKRCKAGTLPAARMPTAKGLGPWRVKGEDVLQLLGAMELARGGTGVVDRPRQNPTRRTEDEYQRLQRIMRSKKR